MQRAGFLAGAAFVIGVAVGTFLVAPAMHREPAARAPAVQQAQTAAPSADPFETARNAGNEAMDAGNCRDAVAAYERALSIRFDADAATDRGVCLRQLGDRQRALAAFEFVTLKQPAHWQARYNLTAVLLELGRVDEAEASLNVFRTQRPGSEELRVLERGLAAARGKAQS
jgi:tetratricopeptide (TPR) repeat protein